jgi:hypothetical protein
VGPPSDRYSRRESGSTDYRQGAANKKRDAEAPL